MTEPRFLLVKGKAGLGNRMLAAATAILYARLTGRRLVVDWSDSSYSDDGANVFPGYFQCPSCRPAEELPLTNSIAPDVWRGRLELSVNELQKQYTERNFRAKTTIDVKRLDYVEELVVLWLYTTRVPWMREAHAGLHPQFPGGSSDEIIRGLLTNELVLQPAIRERIDHFKRTHFHRPAVGVHVRYTDAKVNLRAVLKRLDSLLAAKPYLLVFLATDSLEVKEQFERRYATVLTTPHWYSPTGDHIHQSRECPDRLENGVEALVDLYLLAECEHLVCDTSSSFARVAALLSRAPASNIVDVRSRAGVPAWRRLGVRFRLRVGELQRSLTAAR